MEERQGIDALFLAIPVTAGVCTVFGLAAKPGLPFGLRMIRIDLDQGWICSEVTASDQIDRTPTSDVKRVCGLFKRRPFAFCLVRLGPLMRHSTDDTQSLVVQGSRVSQDS